MVTPYVGITARQLFYEIQRRVSWLSEDVERLIRPDYDPELERYTENPTRTDLRPTAVGRWARRDPALVLVRSEPPHPRGGCRDT
jgi:hypothetical protein